MTEARWEWETLAVCCWRALDLISPCSAFLSAEEKSISLAETIYSRCVIAEHWTCFVPFSGFVLGTKSFMSLFFCLDLRHFPSSGIFCQLCFPMEYFCIRKRSLVSSPSGRTAVPDCDLGGLHLACRGTDSDFRWSCTGDHPLGCADLILGCLGRGWQLWVWLHSLLWSPWGCTLFLPERSRQTGSKPKPARSVCSV